MSPAPRPNVPSVHAYIDEAQRAVNAAQFNDPLATVTLPAYLVNILCIEARNANLEVPR